MRKILCPIDFSEGSQQAMRFAVQIANAINAELQLVHVFYVPPVTLAGELPVNWLHELGKDAERGLASAMQDAKELGAKQVTTQLLNGSPWSAICQAAEDPQFELVVIGTHGRTGLARILVGSVAEKVIRHAPCSVLAVPPQSEPKPFKHALCPVDFSGSSRHAVSLAAELVRPGGAGITLFHAIELPVAFRGEAPTTDFLRQLDKQAAEALDKWKSELEGQLSIPVTTHSRIGRPGSETLAMIDNDDSIDLVAMGSHRHGAIRRALLGSVAEKVVRHAGRPVLVARKRK